MFRSLRISRVDMAFDFQPRRNSARAGMVEWNRILQLFRFSGILGQPREVHPKFRTEIPESVSLSLPTGPVFPEVLGEWKAPRVYDPCKTAQPTS